MILATIGFLLVAFICIKVIISGFVLLVFAKEFDQGEGTLSFLGLLMLLAGMAGIYYAFKLLPFTVSVTG